ncbi:MAG: aldo/keto reductase family protein [Candidatus Omnitrophica bacterium]|nr:aldo/keto reductase family protein [Candidatus Omnitrophota bacterium]
MEYRKIGKWGLKVSCLGLGTYLTIGLRCDEQQSYSLVKTAYDAGVNYFDTANAYAQGQAEIFLGKILKDFPRSSLVILTKVWAPMGSGANDRGLSAKHIREQCHASLKRLQMDYLDIYLCHRADPETPLEETILTMEDLARQGKILYWGISEWPIPFILQAQFLAEKLGARQMAVSQPRYNLLYRYPEKELFPVTRQLGLGHVTFSPLAHGMLTGKYLPGQTPAADTRAADPETNAVIMKMYWTEENKQKAQELKKIAKELGATAAQLAIAWCLRREEVSSVILGARTVEQLKDNLRAVEIKIPEPILKKLDNIFPPPAAPNIV